MDCWVISGGTGFVGRSLVARLSRRAADRLVVIGRSRRKIERIFADYGAVRAVEWDGERDLPVADIEAALASSSPARRLRFVNLAGAGVADRRWNREYKRRLRESRVQLSEHIASGLSGFDPLPRVWINASAIGIYGDRGDTVLDETSTLGQGFLADLTRDWEAACATAPADVRSVQLRVGVVLGAGGLLSRMLPVFRWGLGGRLGSGRQWMAWIHVRDLVRMIEQLGESGGGELVLSGPVNAVAPTPVTNREFTRTLATVLRRPACLPVPRVALRVALGEFSHHAVESQRIVPKGAVEAGFQFEYPQLDVALTEIIAPTGSRAGS